MKKIFKMMVGKLVWAVLPFYLFTFLPLQATEVKSPNGNIVLNFTVEDGRPTYTLLYKGKEVVRPSHLGLELAKDKHASLGLNERDLMDGFLLDKEETSSFDETWQPVWGETRDIRNHYNEYVATLSQQWQTTPPATDQSGKRLQPRRHRRTILIRFRVYDDGIGFRYEFPQQPDLNYFLIKTSARSFPWLVTTLHGGFLAIMTRRSRRLRNVNSLKFVAASTRLSTGAIRLLPSSHRQVCRRHSR